MYREREGDREIHSEESVGLDGMPCVVLWRPKGCRALIPPETCNDFTLNPPSGYRTSDLRA